MVSQAELILRVITLWFLVLSQFLRDGMGPFNTTVLILLLLLLLLLLWLLVTVKVNLFHSKCVNDV